MSKKFERLFTLEEHKKLIDWILQRPEPIEKTAMLLEHFLLLNYQKSTHSVITTKKGISDYTGWSFKTVAKAMESLRETGTWSIYEESRTITFSPNLVSEEMDSPTEIELSNLIWSNSALSDNSLLTALAFVRFWNREEKTVEASMRDIATITGRSLNSIRNNVERMVDSGEWNRVPEGMKTKLAANLDVLSTDRSGDRNKSDDSKKSNNSANFAVSNKSSSQELPFMLGDFGTMHGGNIRPFTRKRSLEAYAQRLYDETDIDTRKNKRAFTHEHLVHIYKTLEKSANIEIIDTLLHYQCQTGGALDLRFLTPVAARLKKSWRKNPPSRFSKERTDSGAYLTALNVWTIIEARQTPRPNAIQHSEETSKDNEDSE